MRKLGENRSLNGFVDRYIGGMINLAMYADGYGFVKNAAEKTFIKNIGTGLLNNAENKLLVNTLPVSTEGKLLGKISNGSISMEGNTLEIQMRISILIR